jgi:predicted permease
MDKLWQDLRYAFRSLRRSPWFAFIAVLTLGLGVAVNTTIFSVVNGMLLRPLPVVHPEQITVLTMQQTAADPSNDFSYPDYLDLQKQADTFSDIFGYRVSLLGLAADGKGSHVIVSRVTGNYFSALGIQPAMGRLILPSEGQVSGADSIIVLSYSYWMKRFGGDPGVVGKQVELNHQPATIIGVAPKEFHGTVSILDMDAYIPISATQLDNNSNAKNEITQRDQRGLTLMGRLKPGTTLEQAKASLAVVAKRLAEQYPLTDKDALIRVYPEKLARPDPDPSGALPAAAAAFLILAGLVLLVACFNIANVLLVRATVRQREMAIRAALGAGRARLVRQHLTESFLLAVAGGIVGIVLATWAGDFLSSLNLNSEIPLRIDFSADGRVYLFALGAIFVTGIVVGIIPAWRVMRTKIGAVLHEGGRGSTDGPRRHLVRSALVVAQVSGSLMLLVVAGLFTRSLAKAQRINLGFNTDHVLNVSLSPDEAGYKEDRSREFYRNLQTRVRELPGVVSSSESFTVPMGVISSSNQVTIEEHPLPPDQQPPNVFNNMVGPSYFQTMQIPLLRGRDISDADGANAPRVAVINETMAKKFWPGEDAIGKRFSMKGEDAKSTEVIGIVKDSKYRGIVEDPVPFFYLPIEQEFQSFRTLHVRTSLPPENLALQIESIVRELGPTVPITKVQTMSDSLNGANGFFLYRFGAQITGTMGLLGLILAVVGVYSVVSYAAAQRTHEIGIRMALGAFPGQILQLVLRQGLGVIGVGLLLGVVLALAGARAFASMFVGISSSDPTTYVIVSALLLAIALFACWIPARRATRVSPLEAIRHE